VIINVEYYTCK